MSVSYKELWKPLIDKNMSKTDLRLATEVSTVTAARLSKGEFVSSEVLAWICEYFKCNIGDIVGFTSDSGRAAAASNAKKRRVQAKKEDVK